MIVGTEEDCFTVHQDLLVHHSSFFRAALTGNFKEADTKAVILADTESQTTELFVHWLYYQRFPTDDDSKGLIEFWHDDDEDGGDTKSTNLLKLYIFSDMYKVPVLKRQVLDEFFHHITDLDLPSTDNVASAFNNLPDDDPMCRLLVDALCYWGNAWTNDGVGVLPVMFITMMMNQYAKFAHGEKDRTCEPELCDYHEHGKAEERVACEKKREVEE
jgi:hypothetical protein